MNKKLIQYAEGLAARLPAEIESLEDYDQIHCNFSGGKDSIALVLLLLFGYKVPRHKLSLVHMRVDGPIENPAFFDWEETDQYLDYCSEKLGIELVTLAADMGLKERIEKRGMWPSSGMQYCTSFQKRDVYSKWARSLGPGKFLCVSGERAEESSKRAKKPVFQVYKHANAPTKKRFVDWFRPVHHLKINEVWELMRLAEIEPHPCYQYVSRCSCKFCIYLSPSEMSKVAEISPLHFDQLVQMEQLMGHSMRYEKKQPLSLVDFIKKAIPEPTLFDFPCEM